MGLVLAGGALIIGLPVLRRALRGTAVAATKVALTVGEQASKLTEDAKTSWDGLVAEAKSQMAEGGGMGNVAAAGLGGVAGGMAGGAVGSAVGGAMAGSVGSAVGATVGTVTGAAAGVNALSGTESESSTTEELTNQEGTGRNSEETT